MGLFRRNDVRVEELGKIGDMNIALQQITKERGIIGEYTADNQQKKKINYKSIEGIFFHEPLTSGGIEKTASKLTSKWCMFDNTLDGETIDENIDRELIQRHKQLNTRNMLRHCIKDSIIFGNGYLEIIPEIQSKDSDPRISIRPEMGISKLAPIEPGFIKHKIKRINENEFYYIHRTESGDESFIHNSRIIHIPWRLLGTMRFGIGVIEIGIKTMLAKINMDWAIGEIIYSFGKPFLVIKTTGGTRKEIKEAYKLLQKINPKTGFAGTEKHDFNILNPDTINPDPFAQYYYINQAAALEMPYMSFIGVQKGAAVGSKVDLSDWYDTLKSKQDTKLTPALNTINNYILKGGWDGDVFWNEIYVDEKSQSEIKKTYSEIIKILYQDAGILTDEVAIQMIRDYDIYNVPDDMLLDYPQITPDNEPYPENPFDEPSDENLDRIIGKMVKNK